MGDEGKLQNLWVALPASCARRENKHPNMLYGALSRIPNTKKISPAAILMPKAIQRSLPACRPIVASICVSRACASRLLPKMLQLSGRFVETVFQVGNQCQGFVNSLDRLGDLRIDTLLGTPNVEKKIVHFWPGYHRDRPQNGPERLVQRRIGNLDGHGFTDYRGSSDRPDSSGASLFGPLMRVTTSFIV